MSRFKPNGSARSDIQSHAAPCVAIKIKRAVGLSEMIMAADLNRPIARVGNHQRDRLTAFVQCDCAAGRHQFSRYHSTPLTNGIVDGDQLGSIGERRFDLNVVDHFGDAFHALLAGDDVGTCFHHVGD